MYRRGWREGRQVTVISKKKVQEVGSRILRSIVALRAIGESLSLCRSLSVPVRCSSDHTGLRATSA